MRVKTRSDNHKFAGVTLLYCVVIISSNLNTFSRRQL